MDQTLINLLFETSAEPMLLLDEELRCKRLNLAACEFFNVLKKDAEKRLFSELLPLKENKLFFENMGDWNTENLSLMNSTLRLPSGRRQADINVLRYEVGGGELFLLKIHDAKLRSEQEEHFLRSTDILQKLSNFSAKLCIMRPEDRPFEYITQTLMEISRVGMVATVSTYCPEDKVIVMDHVRSRSKALNQINNFSRLDVTKIRYRVSDEMYMRMMTIPVEKLGSFYDLMHHEINPLIARVIQKAIGFGYTYGMGLKYDGKLLGCSSVIMPQNAPEMPIHTLEVYANIVSAFYKNKEDRSHLITYQEDLKRLTHDISVAEERERRRLATSLHDDVVQQLALAKIKIGQLEGTELSDSGAKRQEVMDTLDHCLAATRNLTFEISPPVLYEIGLVPAFEWLIEEFKKKYDLLIDLDCQESDFDLIKDTEVLIFHSVRELLINVVKHAAAKHVKVSLNSENQHVRVVVKDDGKGFRVSKAEERADRLGFGLFNVKERIMYQGGDFKVFSEVGQGTTVRIDLPLLS